MFNWGGFAGISHEAVYDETDEIMSKTPSEAWLKRADRTDVSCGVIGALPVGGHFYITRLDC